MSNEQNTKVLPTHRIYSVAKRGEQTIWTELGAAWPHKDGKGFQLKFKAAPFGECEVVLRKIEPKAESQEPRKSSRKRTREFVAASAEAGAQ